MSEAYLDQLLMLLLDEMGLPQKRGRPCRGKTTFKQYQSKQEQIDLNTMISNAIATGVQLAMAQMAQMAYRERGSAPSMWMTNNHGIGLAA